MSINTPREPGGNPGPRSTSPPLIVLLTVAGFLASYSAAVVMLGLMAKVYDGLSTFLTNLFDQ